MHIKTLSLLAICVSFLGGCVFIAPVPKDIHDTTSIIGPEPIEVIVRDREVPDRILNLKWSAIDIYLNDDVCTCYEKKSLKMKVTEVDSVGVKGHIRLAYYSNRNFAVYEAETQKMCKPFVLAQDAIAEAEYLSANPKFFYLDSYKLIWEAKMALWPVGCDPVLAKILADKAMQVSLKEGAKALGFDISGTYESKMTGEHQIFSVLDPINKNHKVTFHIKQDGREISGTDDSGNAILVGALFEEYMQEYNLTKPNNIFKVSLSYPQISEHELEGIWEVRSDGSGIEGIWENPVDNSYGKWNLTKLRQESTTESIGKRVKHERRFLSRKSAVKIRWEDIEYIRVWGKGVEWMWCAGFATPLFADGVCF